MTDHKDPKLSLRPRLVQAAEAVFEAVFKDIRGNDKKLKSQLNHLIAVCNEASCDEEIRLYLRYQASRDQAPIKFSLVDKILEELSKIFGADPSITDVEKLDAWRHYAVYLARAFTYYDAKAKASASANHSHGSSRANFQPQRGHR